MLSLCSLLSNNVRGEVFRRALRFYTQKAGRYNVPSHLISYKQIVWAQSNMRPFWGRGGGGERGINWLVTIYVLAIVVNMRIFVLLFSVLTLRRLMSYIYGAPILDVSRSHTTTQHSR